MGGSRMFDWLFDCHGRSVGVFDVSVPFLQIPEMVAPRS